MNCRKCGAKRITKRRAGEFSCRHCGVQPGPMSFDRGGNPRGKPEMVDYTGLPPHMRDGAKLYIENRIPPGSFLTAVICNDLFGAMGKADIINRASIFDWCSFFYNEAPSECWGSREKFDRWIAGPAVAEQVPEQIGGAA